MKNLIARGRWRNVVSVQTVTLRTNRPGYSSVVTDPAIEAVSS